MSNVGFVIIGQYQKAPYAVLAASKQPGFNDLHGMAVARWPTKPTGWVSEYAGEIDRNPAGHLVYADCVQAAYVAAANLMTHARVAATPENREALQAKEVAMGLLSSKIVGSGLGAAKDAGKALWGIDSVTSAAWATIKSVDDGTGHCWIHDSMNANGEWIRVETATVQPFVASYGNAYLKIVEEAVLPDTSTGGTMDLSSYIIHKYSPVATLHFAAGSYKGWHVAGDFKLGTLAKNSIAHVDYVVYLPPGKAAITGHFYHVVDGIWGGYLMPYGTGLTLEVPVEPTPPPSAPDCTQAVADAVAPLNTKIAGLTSDLADATAALKTANAKIAAAQSALQ